MASAPTPSEIHVLLVDDEGISRTTVAKVLRNCAYRVTEVSDGLEAMHVLKGSLHGGDQDRFHLLLTDVMMPEVDGIALLRFVRAHEALRNLPVVMMSAHEQADTVFECIRGGAEDYLLKPIKKKEVQHIWQHVWRRKTQAQTVPSLHEDGNVENDARHLLMSVPQQMHQKASTNSGSLSAPEKRTAGNSSHWEEREEKQREARKDSLKSYLQRPGRQAKALECLHVFQKLVIEVADLHKKGSSMGVASIIGAKLHPTGDIHFVTQQENPERIANSNIGTELYAAPETLEGGVSTKESDIFVLGMVLLELFHPLDKEEDRLQVLASVRKGSFPSNFTRSFPSIAELCTWMTQLKMESRPTIQDLMECDAIEGACKGLDGIMHGDEADWQELDDSQVRLFLQSVWFQQQANAGRVEGELRSLERDIATIRASLEANKKPSEIHVHKRQKGDTNILEHPVTPSVNKIQQSFEELDHFWFDHRNAKEDSDVDKPATADMLGDIAMDISKFVSHNRMECKATLKQVDLLNNMEMICSMCFDRDDEFFAATGVCKKIKIFEYRSVIAEGMEGHLPVADIACSSKLNSLAWSSYIKAHIASADCAGTVCLWDACSLSPVIEFNEHTSRVWSVDLSPSDPTRLLSGSDDGSIRLWSLYQQRSVGKVDCNTNICSVQFCPTDSNMFAAGTTDHKAYLFDARNLSSPLAVLSGHKNSIAYVRFLGSDSLVTSSTDNTLKLWDLKSACSDGGTSPAVRTYHGHTNEKNFVGLSVHPEGFIASGSEDNTVVAYHKNFTSPMASYKFHSVNPLTGKDELDDRGQFVSSLAFQNSGNGLLAANSSGIIKVLEFA